MEAVPGELGLGDKGYQGGIRLITPSKRSKRVETSEEMKQLDSMICAVRIMVERTIGRLKVFQCLNMRWRSDWETHANTFYTVAQLVNLSLDLQPLIQTPHPLWGTVTKSVAQSQIDENLSAIILNQ